MPQYCEHRAITTRRLGATNYPQAAQYDTIMALRDQPYLPLFVQDFLTDEKLAECSPAATGVYIRLMCLLHKSEEYGKLTLRPKDILTEAEVSALREQIEVKAEDLAGADALVIVFAKKLLRQMPFELHEIAVALAELLDENVVAIDGYTLYQKRMVKDGQISEKRGKAGRAGLQARWSEESKESDDDSKGYSKPHSKTDSKTDSKGYSKPHSKTDSKTDSKGYSKPHSKTDSKTDSKDNSKNIAKPIAKPIANTIANSENEYVYEYKKDNKRGKGGEEENKPGQNGKFAAPSLEEIVAYCEDRRNGIDPQLFLDYYTANGWTQGKGKPIKDWKACVRTWERNGIEIRNYGPARKDSTTGGPSTLQGSTTETRTRHSTI